jgi:hypothetical protein
LTETQFGTNYTPDRQRHQWRFAEGTSGWQWLDAELIDGSANLGQEEWPDGNLAPLKLTGSMVSSDASWAGIAGYEGR